MFGNRIRLFSLLGFEVRADLSWVIIAVLVAWSLSTNLFPAYLPDLSRGAYWAMGIVGALGLFGSIVFHEFWHSVVARALGLPMKGITLFLFGGVAEMSDEPPSARTELWMAAAGPASSVVLGGLLWAGLVLLRSLEVGPAVRGVVGYLSFINLLLAGFNLLPAFPMDGGRILRAILWWARGDLAWATRVATGIGSAFGLVLIIVGLVSVLSGEIVGGVWYFIVGVFLRSAAGLSNRRVQAGRILSELPVSRLMTREPVTVRPGMSLRELFEDYLYRHHFKLFPVVEDGSGRLVGCVSLERLKHVDKDAWDTTLVAGIMDACSMENTVGPTTDAGLAFARMRKTGQGRLMVVDSGRLAGVIAMKDLTRYVAQELGQDVEDDEEEAG